jgi:hypothetical protein
MPTEETVVEELLAEDGGLVVVESKMERGSTHNKDRTTFTAAVSKDNFAEDLQQIRDMQKTDMAARAAFDPNNEEGGDD